MNLHKKGNDASTEPDKFCCGSTLDTKLFQTVSAAVSNHNHYGGKPGAIYCITTNCFRIAADH